MPIRAEPDTLLNVWAHRTYADRAAFDVSSFTAAIWAIKFNTTSGGNIVCRGTAAGGVANWGIRSTGTAFRAEVNFSAISSSASTSGTVQSGVWYHLVATYVSGGNLTLYVDGVAQTAGTTVGSLADDTRPIRVFDNSGTEGNNPFYGAAAYFGFWNEVISVDEINALFAGVPPHYVRPNALVIADELESNSMDLAGMECPTDKNIHSYRQSPPYTNTHLKIPAGNGIRRPSRNVRGRWRKRRPIIGYPPPVSGPVIGSGRLIR